MDYPTTKELAGQGRALRERTPRASLGTGPDLDRDPVAILDAQNAARLPDLVGVRWGRMAGSPFAFYRGAAAVMAHDLASTPVSGQVVQACGDAHLANFGFYASPERALLFDLNDFDETTVAPWEWDVERLAASLAIASRESGFGEDNERAVAVAAARAYRVTMRRASKLSALEVFHTQVTAEDLFTLGSANRRQDKSDKNERRRVKEIERATAKARERTSEHALAKLSVTDDSETLRIVQQPPLMYRPDNAPSDLTEMPERYRSTASPDIEALLRHFRAVDYAIRVVGVGSVGTRCYILLCVDASGSPLFLQVKEASASVLEPYAGTSRYQHNGQRVVAGQRIMQAASDPFLGWTESEGRHYYVRQFRDMKGGFEIERLSAHLLTEYAVLCGGVLARAHAQSCEPALISGYLGRGAEFDDAIATFAVRYADQNERDHATLVEAIASGRVHAVTGA